MGILQILGIAFVVAFAVVGLLKLWESELSITFTSKRTDRGRKKWRAVEFEEDDLLGEGKEEDVRRTRRLKD